MHDLSQTRILAASSLNSNPYLKKPFKETDIIPLPIDGLVKAKPLSKEEFDKGIERAKKLLPFNIG